VVVGMMLAQVAPTHFRRRDQEERVQLDRTGES
jgi:hypothetical protein